MPETPCIVPGDNHSADTVTLWHGRPEPLSVCGYHEMRYRGTQTLFELARKK